MKKILSLIPIVILLCSTLGCELNDDDVTEEAMVAALSDEDVAAIKAIGPALDKAMLTADWNAAVNMMTEDVLLMNPNEPLIQGRAGVRKWFEAFEGATVTEHKHELIEVGGYGDIGYARGAYKETFVMEGVTEPIKGEGKTLLILRKQSDSSWLISIFCWNSDLPLSE